MYILYAQIESGAYVPCAFALLPDKEAETYYRLFGAIHDALTNGGSIDVSPEDCAFDFEASPIAEFSKFWPDTNISGCLFHFKQAILRQVDGKGCRRLYNRSIQFHTIVNKCACLALCPLDSIEEYFLLVEQEFREQEDSFDPEAQAWFFYFQKTYIGSMNHRTGNRKAPLIARKIWNKHQEILDGKETTSNRAEAFNRAFGVRSDTNKTFWSTIESFKRGERGKNVNEQLLFFEARFEQAFRQTIKLAILLKTRTIPKLIFLENKQNSL